MTRGKLIALATAALIALAGGWYFGTATEPKDRTAAAAGQLMFPDLTPKLKDARRIEILSKGDTTVIELKNGVWGVASRGGYHVQDAKLRGVLTALTELRLVEPRTSDPAQFARLGLEDPEKVKDGTAQLLRVLDDKGQTLAALIAGHRRTRVQANVPDEIYVRRPGDDHSWLAEGNLQIDGNPQVWLDRDIVNIPHGQIAKVVAARGAAKIELVRDGDRLKVTEPAAYPKLEDYKLDDIQRVLESLTFQDVKPAGEPAGDKAGEAVFTTQDGLEIQVTVSHLDKDSWTRFSVTGPDGQKAEVDKLNARLANWVFQTGRFKDQALIPALDELKAPPPRPEASPPPRPDAPSTGPGAPPPGPGAPAAEPDAPKP